MNQEQTDITTGKQKFCSITKIKAYDDQIVRQIIECVIVESKEQIRVIFAGGLEVTQSLV